MSEDEKLHTVVESQPEKLINEVAKGIHARQIFTNFHIPEGSRSSMLGMIFMPIVFGAFQDMPEAEVDNIGMIFEYMDKAGPRSINGMPMFVSFGLLSKSDTKKVWDKVKKLEEAEKAALGE